MTMNKNRLSIHVCSSINDLDETVLPEFKTRVRWNKLRTFSRVIGRFQRLKKEVVSFGSKKSFSFYDSLKFTETLSSIYGAKLLFMPNSKIKIIWDLLLILILVYASIFIPLELAFGMFTQGIWYNLNTVTDIIFGLDLIFTFNTGIINESGEIITDRKIIAKAYLKSWFIIDFISCFPFEAVHFSEKKEENSVFYNHFFRFLRFNRLYRISRLFKILKKLKISSNYGLSTTKGNIVKASMRFVYFFLTLIFSVHFLGCFWLYLYTIQGNTVSSWGNQIKLMEISQSEKYIASVYYVFATLTTVGYGDIKPTNNTEKLFAMAMMVFGVFLYAFTVSGIATIGINDEAIETLTKSKLIGLKEISLQFEFPDELIDKVKKIIRKKSKQITYPNYNLIENVYNLPPNLRKSVLEHLHKNIIDGLHFFENKPQSFISTLAIKLNLNIYNLNDVIYEEYELADEVYFLKFGFVKLSTEGCTFRVYGRGSYFGDVEVLENLERDSNAIVASETAEIYALFKDDFLEIFEEFPEFYDEVYKVAETRKQKHRNSKNDVLSFASPNLTIRSMNSIRHDSIVSEYSERKSYSYRRSDTSMTTSMKYDDETKRRNRRLWSKAIGKNLELDIDQDTFKRIDLRGNTTSVNSFRRGSTFLNIPTPSSKAKTEIRRYSDSTDERMKKIIDKYSESAMSIYKYDNELTPNSVSDKRRNSFSDQSALVMDEIESIHKQQSFQNENIKERKSFDITITNFNEPSEHMSFSMNNSQNISSSISSLTYANEKSSSVSEENPESVENSENQEYSYYENTDFDIKNTIITAKSNQPYSALKNNWIEYDNNQNSDNIPSSPRNRRESLIKREKAVNFIRRQVRRATNKQQSPRYRIKEFERSLKIFKKTGTLIDQIEKTTSNLYTKINENQLVIANLENLLVSLSRNVL
ncbi:hypothetical protein SteCoe_8913 [Stentor coeruleus]|uniref:Cyclic nucleotide-binding domain-containing protein n=1 Tax=Stentor coeruleus TaxID=5963 RepID=A0A1R2CJ13_9CILI|nr:hypothetical protein SteCoe_8913 [Stentor coeruleus]